MQGDFTIGQTEMHYISIKYAWTGKLQVIEDGIKIFEKYILWKNTTEL